MNTTYAQRQTTAQKKDAPSASSVFDASSQSESLQRKADMANGTAQRVETPRPNNTGMPDNLKAGIESLSGFSMDDVRVHYNSSKPATVQALAYTQGTDIHVAPGQEKHLPHEAWHVAQQMAGRVSPTTNINGMPVNDNAALEHEADVMGEKAVQCKFFADGVEHYISLNKKSAQLKKCIQRVGDKIRIESIPNAGEAPEVQAVRNSVREAYNRYVDEKKNSRRTSRRTHEDTLKNVAVKNKKLAVKGYEDSQIEFKLSVDELVECLNSLNRPGLSVERYENTSSYSVNFGENRLFIIWVDNDRFVGRDPKPEERGIHRPLFVRKDERSLPLNGAEQQPKDYIYTSNECYIPRYVYRYLNSFDTANFSTNSKKKIVKGVKAKNGEIDPDLCEIDPRNPFFLDESVKKISLNDFFLRIEEKLVPLSDWIVGKFFLQKEFVNTSITDKNVQPVNDEFKKNLKLRCACEFKPFFQIDESSNDEKNKVFVLINRMLHNVRRGAWDSLYSFFDRGEYAVDDAGRHFWTLYNGSLDGDAANKQAILEHMRSKQKQGGSGFISCTATKHPIFGSGGSDFFCAKYRRFISAVAKIDLAKIPGDVHIYSTYSKKAMGELFRTSRTGLGQEVVPQTEGDLVDKNKINREISQDDFDKNSAARDAMRTREILIDGPIPKSAIVAVYYNYKYESVKDFQNNPDEGRKCWRPE